MIFIIYQYNVPAIYVFLRGWEFIAPRTAGVSLVNSAADGSTMYPLMVFFYNLYLQLLDDLKRGSIADPYHIMGAVMLNILFASIVEKTVNL